MKIYLELDVFGDVPVNKKHQILSKGRILCTFQVFPAHFYCTRGPSLVELAGADNSTIITVAVIQCLPKSMYGHHIHIAEYGSTE